MRFWKYSPITPSNTLCRNISKLQPPSVEMIENKQRILTNFAVHFWLHKEIGNKEKTPDLIYQWMPLINAIIGELHCGVWSLTIWIQIKPVSCHINHTKLAPAICDILSELTAIPKYKYKCMDISYILYTNTEIARNSI